MRIYGRVNPSGSVDKNCKIIESVKPFESSSKGVYLAKTSNKQYHYILMWLWKKLKAYRLFL